MRLPKSDDDTPIADEDPSESFPLSLKKCITLANAASFNPGVVLLAVISAKVSRNVDRFWVHAGPMSCNIFDIPIDESDPSDGDTLLATPEANAPSDIDCELMLMLLLLLILSIFISISCFGFLSLSRIIPNDGILVFLLDSKT
jgi:hypothetical protein